MSLPRVEECDACLGQIATITAEMVATQLGLSTPGGIKDFEN